MDHKTTFERLLELEESVLLTIEREQEEVAVGVPHHAPLGVRRLPTSEHPAADENTGVIGYEVSRLLTCNCVIACNYFMDPNKHGDSDYSKRISAWKPNVLVEIHGHGSNHANYDVEISSGSRERNKISTRFAALLRQAMAKTDSLSEYQISGSFDEIYYKATNSWTINNDRWIPFHIELPFSIRSDPALFSPLSQHISTAVKAILAEL